MSIQMTVILYTSVGTIGIYLVASTSCAHNPHSAMPCRACPDRPRSARRQLEPP